MNCDSGIYMILNVVNNKCYIGSSKNIKIRLYQHKRELKNNIHINDYLQKAWKKYGEENFQFWILENCNENDLLSNEQYWLDYYTSYNEKNGYNLAKYTQSPMKGKKHKIKDIEKIKKSLKGKNCGCLNGNSRLNEKEIKEIVKMINEKVTHKNIAKMYNVSTSTISDIYNGKSYKNLNLKIERKIKNVDELSNDEINKIIILLKQQYPIKEISNKLNVLEKVVNIIKKNNKIKKPKRKKLSNKEKMLIIKMINEKIPYKKIAHEFNISEGSIYHLIRRIKNEKH